MEAVKEVKRFHPLQHVASHYMEQTPLVSQANPALSERIRRIARASRVQTFGRLSVSPGVVY
jgi:hypothetical protein